MNKPIKQIKTGNSGDGIEFVNTEIKYSDLWKYNRWSDEDLKNAFILGLGKRTLHYNDMEKFYNWIEDYKKQKGQIQ